MQPRILSALAALSLISAPAALHAAKPAEVELHIEASASVPPDRAEVPLTIQAAGTTEAEARAALAEREKDLRTDLDREGIGADQIKGIPGPDGKDTVTVEENVDAGCAAAYEAEEVAAEAANAAAPRKGNRPKRDLPVAACPKEYAVTKTVLITVTGDMSKVERLGALREAGEYGSGRLRLTYSQSDPAAARAKARADALAKAQAEGAAYADAMGYRVVRIVRVSNGRPAMAMTDLISFIAVAETRSGAMQPSWFAATVTETVAIDFVMVPK